MVEEVIKNGSEVVRIAEQINMGGTLSIIISLLFLALISFYFISTYRKNDVKIKEDKEDKKMLMQEMKTNNKTSMDTMRTIADSVKEFAESNRTLSNIIERNEFNHQVFVSDSQQIRRDYLNALDKVNDSACNVHDRVGRVEKHIETISNDVKEIKAYIKVK